MKDETLNFIIVIIFCLIFGGFIGYLFGIRGNSENITLMLGSITAIATVVLAITTYYYVRLTSRLVKVQTQPLLNITIKKKFIRQMEEVYFVIENSGATTAYDITFEVVPDNYEYKTNNSFKDFVYCTPFVKPDLSWKYE